MGCVFLISLLHRTSSLKSEGLQTTNGVENVERLADGDLIVSFKTRSSAEQVRGFYSIDFLILTEGDGSQQGYAKGTNLPTVGQIEVTWYAPGPGPSKPAPSEQSAPAEMVIEPTNVGKTSTDKSAQEEEEAVASGWGDDGEDGMGML